ncbi:hypothetical protein LXM50_01600 [Microbacterium sp. Au-Mic1]|uniref:hypothetical protein n=1 Tax=Microbacterium sp. Au-Mic1 TaxID=2906457 RepID=UPI001E4FAEB3|nr:hypothetical protein [Microbacterium sp. Au-Mic1]MCE4024661.1 hypothetical protein [Microbacterium sp. Au-Mic1]
MTVSLHTYSAALVLGVPYANVPLSIKAGRITLDVARFPHVDASLTVPVTDTAQLVNFDPRLKRRVIITAGSKTGALIKSRTFNLSLRKVRPNRATGDVELSLASDEAVLQDVGPLADDTTPRQYASSIRALTNYVLSKIGASLEPGTDDANVTPYWDAVNLIKDPRYIGTAGQWSQANVTTAVDTAQPGPINGVAHNGVHIHTPTSNDGYVTVGAVNGMNFGVQIGKTYVFSANGAVRTVIGGSGPVDTDMNTGTTLPRQRALVVHATGGGFSPAYKVWHSPQVPNTASSGAVAGTRVSVKFTVPQGTSDVFFRVYHGGTSGNITWSQFSLQEVDPAMPEADGAEYFFGSRPSTPAYGYKWRDTADNSPSEREAVVERPRELFTWRAGQGGVDFLSPILQSQGFRLVCDENQKWTLRKDGYRAPGALNLSYGVNIIAADEETSRESDDWFDGAVYSYAWPDANGAERRQDDSYFLTPTPTKIVRREVRREYPGPGRARYAVERAQAKGRTLTLETVSDWDARAEQELLVRLDGTPIQLGTTDSVEFDLSNDRMRISSRTADTPEGAIDLATGTIDAAIGSIDSN